nr:RNA-directed DNA polymerase, eukaryota, reverse transcriptase zinc-binding domain protein [Tanacetum cinerariifolium]
MVGDYMSRYSSWSNTIQKVRARLSKWKVKTLSVGGRLTLLKLVLGAVSIYKMSLFKTPKRVLHEMEMIRNRFFNVGDDKESRITWVAWEKVLSSKKNGSLGVSSFFALNRAILFKWIWHFFSQDDSLCSFVASKGLDFLSHCKIRVGDGSNTRFLLDTWILDSPLYVRFPRLFALESVKDISVAVKWGAPSLDASFRRRARDGAESNQWSEYCSMLDSVTLSSSPDRIFCDLNGEGEFRVKDIRSSIDDTFL